jgi:hypothetical protein
VAGDDGDLAETQKAHWQSTYSAHPGMYGQESSVPAVHAAGVFRAAGAREVLELGAGHGRDALFFAAQGFTVQAPTSPRPAWSSCAGPRSPAKWPSG